MRGEGDKADLAMAKQAYSIVRGGTVSDLPHWDDLPDAMRSALQFTAAHATLSEREACATEVERLFIVGDMGNPTDACEINLRRAASTIRSR